MTGVVDARGKQERTDTYSEAWDDAPYRRTGAATFMEFGTGTSMEYGRYASMEYGRIGSEHD